MRLSDLQSKDIVNVDDGFTGEMDIPIAIRRGSYINMLKTNNRKA